MSALLEAREVSRHYRMGEIVFDGRSLSPLSKREMARYRLRSVGMIFQNFNLIPTMTAAENVELALAFGGMTGRARVRRARPSPPRGVVGRRAAARRHRPRPRQQSSPPPRGRADGQPRLVPRRRTP